MTLLLARRIVTRRAETPLCGSGSAARRAWPASSPGGTRPYQLPRCWQSARNILRPPRVQNLYKIHVFRVDRPLFLK